MLKEHVPFFVSPQNPKFGNKELHAIPHLRTAHLGDRRNYLKALGTTVPRVKEPLDFTPNYGTLSRLSNIKLMFPSIKILLTVRDPVARFYSALDHAKQAGKIDPSMSDLQAFELSVSANRPSLNGWKFTLLQNGLFVPPIRAAYRLFGRDNVFLTALELLSSEASQKELARLANFIEMPQTTFDGATFPKRNASQSSGRSFPDIPRTRRTRKGEQILRSFYAQWDCELAKLLEERES